MEHGTKTGAATAAALTGFAANSLLCRLALRSGAIDPVAFTGVRILSGAVMLWILCVLSRAPRRGGSWSGACALFVYAITFSLAYVRLSAGVGAFVLFGAVQTTMLGRSLARGERFSLLQSCGLALAILGLALLTLPGASAPDAGPTLLMVCAGVAWAVYTLLGRSATHSLAATADNFGRATLFAATLFVLVPTFGDTVLSWQGIGFGVASGSLASGLGYALWYRALQDLTTQNAALLQLLVPVLAAALGVVLLEEVMTAPRLLGGAAILLGVVLAVARRGPGLRAGRPVCRLGTGAGREPP